MSGLGRWLLAGLILGAGTATLLLHLQRERIEDLEHRLKRKRSQLEALADVVAQIDALRSMREEVEERLVIAKELGSGGGFAPGLLGELAGADRALGLRLSRVHLRGGFLEIEGVAPDRASVNRLGDRLDQRRLIEDYDLRSFEPARAAGGSTDRGRFRLVAKLDEPGRRGRRRRR